MKEQVSVILCAYNNEKTIEECIKGLLNQSFKNYEMVIVNDLDSKDKTSKLIHKFKNSKIKIFDISHVGRSKARNLGFSKSKGDIVIFAETDAKYEKDYLERIVKNFKELGVGGVLVNSEGWSRKTFVQKVLEREMEIRNHEYQQGKIIPKCGQAYRRKIIEKEKFDENMDVAEDVDLGLRIMKHDYKIVFEPKLLWFHEFLQKDLTSVAKKSYWFGKEMSKQFYKKYPNQIPKMKFAMYIAIFFSFLLGFFNTYLFLSPFLLLFGLSLLRTFSYFKRAPKELKKPSELKYLFSLSIISLVRDISFLFGFMLK